MPALSFPPFPDDVPTHSLLIIDFGLLKEGNPKEVDRLWEAATKLGFWYLKNHGAEEEANQMFDLGAEVMALPLEEKMKFELGDSGNSFGYKAPGLTAVDATGETDTLEFMNISQDDTLAWPKHPQR